MREARKGYLDSLSDYEKKAHIQDNIKFSWYIDEVTLLATLLQLKLYHFKYDYLVDDDFEKYVFSGITMKEALLLADKLDQDCQDRYTRVWKKHPPIPTAICPKARYIRATLLDRKDKDKFWNKNPDSLLGYVRKISCICHDTGSFHASIR